jgi:hypothetical protein
VRTSFACLPPAKGFALVAASLVLALALAACGGDEASSGSAPSATPDPSPVATATATATPTETPEASAPSAPTPPADAPGSGEDQPGGGGDESEARVPVDLHVGPDGGVSPPEVSVPAFLSLELRVRNGTAGTVTVTVEGSDPAGPFAVGAGKTGTRRLVGMKPGRYAIVVSGAGRATLVVGAEPGP